METHTMMRFSKPWKNRTRDMREIPCVLPNGQSLPFADRDAAGEFRSDHAPHQWLVYTEIQPSKANGWAVVSWTIQNQS